MHITQFDYELDTSRIAHTPANPRDTSKLMVVHRDTGKTQDHHFFELPKLLTENDVLVFNNTKVFPARLFGTKDTGGKIEILLTRPLTDTQWYALYKGHLTVGQQIQFAGVTAQVKELVDGQVLLAFNGSARQVKALIDEAGHTPIPPYIHTDLSESELRKRYQTVYAQENGSIAAPTAGLHFTDKLIQNLKAKGVTIEEITLHVGIGTFAPVKTDELKDHTMHTEWYEVSEEVAARLNAAKAAGKRIVAVGTTTTRVLESLSAHGKLTGPLSGSTDIFIYPPYAFSFVDALITNFHLPKSTLLALVSAFVSSPNTKHEFTSFSDSVVGKAYEEAQKNGYRFFSFGDAMFIQ